MFCSFFDPFEQMNAVFDLSAVWNRRDIVLNVDSVNDAV